MESENWLGYAIIEFQSNYVPLKCRTFSTNHSGDKQPHEVVTSILEHMMDDVFTHPNLWTASNIFTFLKSLVQSRTHLPFNCEYTLLSVNQYQYLLLDVYLNTNISQFAIHPPPTKSVATITKHLMQWISTNIEKRYYLDLYPSQIHDYIHSTAISTYTATTPVTISSIYQEVTNSSLQSLSTLCHTHHKISCTFLPAEVFYLIMEYLDAKSLYAMSYTCKFMNQLSLEIIPGLLLKLYPHQVNSVSWMLNQERDTRKHHNVLWRPFRLYAINLSNHTSPSSSIPYTNVLYDTYEKINCCNSSSSSSSRSSIRSSSNSSCSSSSSRSSNNNDNDNNDIKKDSTEKCILYSTYSHHLHERNKINCSNQYHYLYFNLMTAEISLQAENSLTLNTINTTKQTALSHPIVGVPWMSKGISGGLLCDEPGLGKTITMLAVILRTLGKMSSHGDIPSDISLKKTQASLRHAHIRSRQVNIVAAIPSSTTLIVVPEILRTQWREQIDKHISSYVVSSDKVYVDENETVPLPTDLSLYSIVVTTHKRLAMEWNSGKPKNYLDIQYEKRQERIFIPYDNRDNTATAARRHDSRNTVNSSEQSANSPLLNTIFYRIIFDEGHTFGKSSITDSIQFASLLLTKRRWILSGTPTPTDIQKFLPYLYQQLVFLKHPLLMDTNTTVFRSDQVWKQLVSNTFHPRSCVEDYTGKNIIVTLLQQSMIRHVKEYIVEIPKPRITTIPLYLSTSEASIYNLLVSLAHTNLVLTDLDYTLKGAAHQDSLLNSKNRNALTELISNLRIATCGAGQCKLYIKKLEDTIHFIEIKLGEHPLCTLTTIDNVKRHIYRALDGDKTSCEKCSKPYQVLIITPCGHLFCAACTRKNEYICSGCSTPYNWNDLQRLQPGYECTPYTFHKQIHTPAVTLSTSSSSSTTISTSTTSVNESNALSSAHQHVNSIDDTMHSSKINYVMNRIAGIEKEYKLRSHPSHVTNISHHLSNSHQSSNTSSSSFPTLPYSAANTRESLDHDIYRRVDDNNHQYQPLSSVSRAATANTPIPLDKSMKHTERKDSSNTSSDFHSVSSRKRKVSFMDKVDIHYLCDYAESGDRIHSYQTTLSLDSTMSGEISDSVSTHEAEISQHILIEETHIDSNTTDTNNVNSVDTGTHLISTSTQTIPRLSYKLRQIIQKEYAYDTKSILKSKLRKTMHTYDTPNLISDAIAGPVNGTSCHSLSISNKEQLYGMRASSSLAHDNTPTTMLNASYSNLNTDNMSSSKLSYGLYTMFEEESQDSDITTNSSSSSSSTFSSSSSTENDAYYITKFPVSATKSSSIPYITPTTCNSSIHTKRLVAPKIVIFSEFPYFLTRFAIEFQQRGIAYSQLMGGKITQKNKELVRFKNISNVRVLLLSSEGSHGLDLSFVTHIFLMNTVMNDSVQQQVISRAYRMGATQSVCVEQIYTYGTIEETLYHMKYRHDSSNKEKIENDIGQTLSPMNDNVDNTFNDDSITYISSSDLRGTHESKCINICTHMKDNTNTTATTENKASKYAYLLQHLTMI